MNRWLSRSLCISAVLSLFVGNIPNRDVLAMESFQNVDQPRQSSMAIQGPLNVLVIGEKGVGKSAIANYMRQNLKGEFPVNKSPVQHGKVFQAQNNPRCKIVEIDVDELLNNKLGIDTKFLVDNANLVFYVMNERSANFETYKKFYNGFNRIWINDPNFEFSPYGEHLADFWNEKLAENGRKYGVKYAQTRYMFNIFNGDKEQYEKFNIDHLGHYKSKEQSDEIHQKNPSDYNKRLRFDNYVALLPDSRNVQNENLSTIVNLDLYCGYIKEAIETGLIASDNYTDENLNVHCKYPVTHDIQIEEGCYPKKKTSMPTRTREQTTKCCTLF